MGFTFLASGFVKVADPMGMTHKLYAYMAHWGVPVTNGSLLLQVGAVVLGVAEFMLGVYLVLGARRRMATPAVAVVMALMTGLTAWI